MHAKKILKIAIQKKTNKKKKRKHIPSGFPMPTKSSFRSIENKHYVYIEVKMKSFRNFQETKQ